MNVIANSPKNQDSKIFYLDGLRGVAAIAVVIAHVITGFYPALYTGDARQAHNAWEVWMAGSPFNMVSIGNCFVCIFFMLSGYVLTYSVLSKGRQNQLLALVVGRYVRLTLPILAAGFVSYLILKNGLAFHMAAAEKSNSYWWLLTLYQFEPDLMDMLKESLYTVYRFSTAYNPALWTMRIELLGSFLVFGILAFCRTVRFRMAAYLVIAIFFFDPYYFCFVAGMFLYDCREWSTLSSVRNDRTSGAVTVLMLLAGFFLGAYPYAYTIGTWYQGMAELLVPKFGESASVISHLAGAVFLMIAVERSQIIKNILLGKILQFWGRNAFSIYLLHLILIVSVFSGIFNWALTRLPYNLASLFSAAVYFAVLMGASNVMLYLVDKPSIRLSHRIGRGVESLQARVWHGVANMRKKTA